MLIANTNGHNSGNIYSVLDIAPTLRADRFGLKVMETVKIKQATKQGYIPCDVGGVADLSYPTRKNRRGRVIGGGQICPTIMTAYIPNKIEKWIWKIRGNTYKIRIRKLTPRECWRLMGFSNEDYEKAQAVNSNTQLYAQAGNSIFKQML